VTCPFCSPQGRTLPLHRRGCPYEYLGVEYESRVTEFRRGQDEYRPDQKPPRGKSRAYRFGWRNEARSSGTILREK
jgi:hypothetical protein